MCEKSPVAVALHTTTPCLWYKSCGPHSRIQLLSKQLNPIFGTAVFGTHITLLCDEGSVIDLYLPLWLTAVLISFKKTHVNRGEKNPQTTKNLLPKDSSFPAQAEVGMLSPNGDEI